MHLGPANLTVTELIAVLWGVGTRKEEVLSMAHRVLREYGEKAILHESSPQQMAEALNIPLVKACQIIASFEIGRRFFDQQGGGPVFIRNTEQAYDYLRGMGSSQKEQLRGLYLSSRYEVIYDEVISIGSLTASIIHPREVFAPALSHSAVAVIIAHNHPSGSTQPTADDQAVTIQLKAAGQILGIDLLDHLIITHNDYLSLMEHNQ